MSYETERQFDESDFSRSNSCTICNSTNIEAIGTRLTIHPNSRFSVQIRRCLDCDHWDTYPMPKADLLALLYSESSLSVLGENWASAVETGNRKESLAPDSHWIVKDLLHVKPANFLEIGPGGGSLLRKMRQLGWNAYGVDLGSYASGFQVVSSLSQLPGSVSYDVIVFQDVLEHVSDPSYELSSYLSLLNPGATLFMTVPWSESRTARFGKTEWEMVRPLGHLHYYSKRSAKFLLERNNFEVFSITTVNVHGDLPQRAKSLARSTLGIAFAMLRPSRWKDLRNRINCTKTLMRSLTDANGDQLYIKARKLF